MRSKTRLLLVAPGRGSYGRAELGSLGRAGGDLLERADALRRAARRPALSELDGAERFSPSRHLAGEHASALIYTGTQQDAAAIAARDSLQVVGVMGNSMGWYSALAIAGALSFDDGFRLVDGMGWRQQDGVVGGQLLTAVVDADWRFDAARAGELEALLAEVSASAEGRGLWLSIRLGGQWVIAGTEEGLAELEARLTPYDLGKRRYPFRLALHSAFHCPLMGAAAEAARELLGTVAWRRQGFPLIDGAGQLHLAYGGTERAKLASYTAGPQVLETFDFTAALRVALRELCPDQVVLLGPGASLGSAIAQVMISEGWRGLRDRADFERAQSGEDRPLVALGRADQRLALLGPEAR